MKVSDIQDYWSNSRHSGMGCHGDEVTWHLKYCGLWCLRTTSQTGNGWQGHPGDSLDLLDLLDLRDLHDPPDLQDRKYPPLDDWYGYNNNNNNNIFCLNNEKYY